MSRRAWRGPSPYFGTRGRSDRQQVCRFAAGSEGRSCYAGGKDGTHVVAYTVATIGWAMVGGCGPVQLLLTPRAAVKVVR